MSITIKNKYIVFFSAILLIGVFLLGGYFGRRKGDRVNTTLISALRDTILTQKVKIHGLEMTSYQISQVVMSQKQALQTGFIERDELRKLHIKTLNELTRMKLQVGVLLDSIKHTGKIIHLPPDTVFVSPRNCLLLPFEFMENNKYLSLTGSFDNDGNMSFDLNVPINLDVYTFVERRTHKAVTTVTVDNHYVKINEISSVKLDLPKVKKFGIGLHAGYGINIKDEVSAQPYIGVGVSYNFISF